MVSQEEKCTQIISQVRLPPLFLSLTLLVVGPGEASPTLPLSWLCLWGWGGPPLYLLADTAPLSLSLDRGSS